MKIGSLSLGMPYGAREHRQRKRNQIEERNVIIIPSFPIVSTTIGKKKKKKRHWFQIRVHIYNSEQELHIRME